MTLALRHRPVPIYLVSFFITNVGVGGFTLATGLTLFAQTGTARTFALLVGVEYAIGFFGQLVGGSILDRLPVLTTALVANGTRAIAVLAGGLTAWLSGSNGPLVVVFLISAFIRPLFRSASFVLVRSVCPPERLPQVNALRFGLLQAAQLTGLAVVGLFYAFLPPGAVVVVVAGFFALGTLLLSLLRRSVQGMRPADAEVESVSLAENWRQLGRALTRTSGLAVHLILGGFPVVLVSLATVLVAPVNAAVAGGSLGILVLDGAATLGALLVIVTSRRWRLASVPPVVVACLLGIVALAVLPVGTDLAVAGVAFLLLGGGAALGATALDTLMQLRGDPVILGRLAVSQECASSLTAIALIPLLGPLLSDFGLATSSRIYALVAFGYLVLVLVAYIKLRSRLFGQPVDTVSMSRDPA